MKHTPCEYIVWNWLPVIRKEIVRCMINNYGLNQKEAADKLGITSAAVSQYISGKRGHSNINDEKLFQEIKITTYKIIHQEDEIIKSEICRLCKIFKSNKKIYPYQ